MGQDQAGLTSKACSNGGLVVEVVGTLSKRFPIQRDAAPRWISCGIPQTSGVAVETGSTACVSRPWRI